jgi:hypothetical protein
MKPDLTKLTSRDLATHYRASLKRGARLITRWAHAELADAILAEFRRRKEWPGDVHHSAVATTPSLCDACGDELPEGDTCWEVAGGETGPGAIGYYCVVCDGCFAYDRLMDAGVAP